MVSFLKRSNTKLVGICLVDTVFSLFFFLINNRKDENVLFIVSDGVPRGVRKKLSNCVYLRSPRHFLLPFRIIYKTLIHLLFYFVIRSLKTNIFYGQDHTWFSPLVFWGKEFVVFEDGVANYNSSNFEPELTKLHAIKRLLFGKLSCQGLFGNNEWTKQIVLSGRLTIPEKIKEKVEVRDIRLLWNNLEKYRKEEICQLFDLTQEDIDLLRRKKVIVLTQPLIEIDESFCSDYPLIYESYISKFPEDDVLIKVHPREVVNYKIFFPKVQVLNKAIPMELLLLFVSNLKVVITYSSSAVFSFDESVERIFVKL